MPSNKRWTVAILLIISISITTFITIRQLGTMTLRACVAPSTGTMSSTSDSFATDYTTARNRFLDAARLREGGVENLRHPEVGPASEPLFMDIASFGEDDAPNVLVVSSGTHGVEGFAGSAIQTRLLRDEFETRLPANVRLLMIHAINPYGMAHFRRANEDNVDLNRNFRDHSRTAEPNAEYERLADVIAPRLISFWPEVMSWSKLLWTRAWQGEAAIQAAVSRGQYSHPYGLFYGGRTATWSNRTLHSVVNRYLSNATRVVVVDLHTGLGAYGTAEVILNVSEDTVEFQRAVQIWGPEITRSTVGGDSVSAHLDATLKLAFSDMLPIAEITSVGLEFGTEPLLEVFKALRGENWLHHHGGPNHPRAQELKSCLLRAFHPGTQDWEAAVWEHGKNVIEEALAYLS